MDYSTLFDYCTLLENNDIDGIFFSYVCVVSACLYYCFSRFWRFFVIVFVTKTINEMKFTNADFPAFAEEAFGSNAMILT